MLENDCLAVEVFRTLYPVNRNGSVEMTCEGIGVRRVYVTGILDLGGAFTSSACHKFKIGFSAAHA